MLSRTHRLTDQRDITRVMRTGQRLVAPLVSVWFTPGEAPKTRVACVVGKKVSKYAVWRHRYQRWLRVAAKETFLSLSGAYDVVIMARPTLGQETASTTVREQLAKVAAKLT